MPNPILRLPGEPTELSISSLQKRLRSDCDDKGLSPKNHAHRARVIRQQRELLAGTIPGEAWCHGRSPTKISGTAAEICSASAAE